MALKATIFKAELQISNIDQHYYETHQLTVARHPSETDLRMMLRILAFALNASERLEFTKGLSTDSEPDLWQKSLSNEIELWIELGQPDEKRLRKACHGADSVIIYCYNTKSSDIWWSQIRSSADKFSNLTVHQISDDSMEAMAELTQRQMALNITIQDGEIWMTDGEANLELKLQQLKSHV